MSKARPVRWLGVLVAAIACGPGLGTAGPASAQGTEPAAARPEVCDFAETAYREGRLNDALRYTVLCMQIDPSLTNTMNLLLARTALRLANPDMALLALAGVGGPEGKYVPGYQEFARLLIAEQTTAVGTIPEAEQRARATLLEGMTLVPDDAAIDALRLDRLVSLDRLLDRRADLVRHAAALAALPFVADRDALAQECATVLADPTSLTDAEVERLYSETPRDSPVWPSIARRRIDAAIRIGDLATARTMLDDVAASAAPPAWLDEVRARIDDLASVDATRIGALLPLSGPSSEVGTRALRALEVAAAEAGGSFVVEARDTRSDEATTRAAIRSLVDESKVIAIVGPIEARVASAAAAEATAAGVPLVELNVQRGIASAAGCVFREFSTYDAEIEALADYGWNHARGRTFAVARAEGRYGELLDGLLSESVRRRGGEVSLTQTYPPDRTEFLDDAQAIRRAAPDAILMADAGTRVSLLAPALAYQDVWPQPYPHDASSARPSPPRKEALYLLPSLAADPAALSQAPRYLEGAAAAVGFVPAATEEARGAFERAFVEASGAAPTQLDAYAHDAVAIVASLVAGGADNRPALCRALDAAERAPSAVAPFSGFDADGEPIRSVRIAIVRGGALALPDESGTAARDRP